MDLITIKTSHYASDLAVLKSRLEYEGIPCYVDGELTSQVLNHIPSIQASLKIHKSNYERAKEILIETGELLPDNSVVNCPKCGSERYKVKGGLKEKLRFVILLLLTLFVFTPARENRRELRFICKRCENEFSK